MRSNRRDVLRMSSSSFALVALGKVLASLVPGATRPATAAPLSDLSSHDAMGLAELVRTRQITPGEAVEDAIRKIEAVNAAAYAQVRTRNNNGSQRIPWKFCALLGCEIADVVIAAEGDLCPATLIGERGLGEGKGDDRQVADILKFSSPDYRRRCRL